MLWHVGAPVTWLIHMYACQDSYHLSAITQNAASQPAAWDMSIHIWHDALICMRVVTHSCVCDTSCRYVCSHTWVHLWYDWFICMCVKTHTIWVPWLRTPVIRLESLKSQPTQWLWTCTVTQVTVLCCSVVLQCCVAVTRHDSLDECAMTHSFVSRDAVSWNVDAPVTWLIHTFEVSHVTHMRES